MEQTEILARRARLAQLAQTPQGERDFTYCAPELWKLYDGTNKAGNQIYRSFTDAELLAKLTDAAAQLGSAPKQNEVYCIYRHYIRLRFGNWPRALEAAGLRVPKRLRTTLKSDETYGGKQMKSFRKVLSFLLVVCLLLGLGTAALAVSEDTLQGYVTKSGAHLLETVKNPQVGSIGGEWAILGLARSGCDVSETYYQDYYAAVETYVKACKGVLHEKKYTEYSRVIVALAAIGKDPTNVAGYNLLTPLGDFDKTIWQGINGPIWALIALDAGNFAMPQNPAAATQATRQMYIDEILSRQLDDGGWNLTEKGGAGTADADITGMALQALAKYQEQAAVKTATDEALACLSAMQRSDGGFASWSTTNSESCVQVIVALCELGVPLDDARFVKSGNTVLDNLLTYCNADGSFKHTADGSGNNQMSFEQGFYGLVAALRAATNKSSLYRMSDAISIGAGESTGLKKGEGLESKHSDVKPVAVTAPGLTFDDIYNSANRAAIEALAARGIINGKGNGMFDPNANMTRAEFATIVTRALGLGTGQGGAAGKSISDVIFGVWYHDYVLTAAGYGIVNGVGNGSFNPDGTITRQEAAAMVTRAAKLCGMDTALSAAAVRDVLAQFGDYVTVADWAQSSMAFCYQEGILDQSALDILPQTPILRCEIAQMLFNLLTAANLL